MGYTHYYRWDAPLSDATTKFPLWSQEVRKIVEEVQRRKLVDWGEMTEVAPGVVVWKTDVIIAADFVCVNGPQGQGCEAFVLTLQDCLSTLTWESETRPFTKTQGLPYDLAVTAALIQFWKYFPEATIHSDGGFPSWKGGLELCQHLFGEKAGNIPASLGEED
jgi:hypothetical protein